MKSQSKSSTSRILKMLPAMIALLFTFNTLAAAQDQTPKWELYGGYSFFYPRTTVTGTLPGALFPLSSRVESNPNGVGVSGTYNFNRWFGITLDGSNHWGSGETTLFTRLDDGRFSNISIGPKVTFRSTHFAPFLEALVGDHRFVPEAFHSVDKAGLMLGGGLDIVLSRHFAYRLLRADYVVSNYNFGPSVPATNIRGVRLQMGLNYMFGGGPAPAPPTAACSVQPTEVFAGEPVSATATGSGFNAKRTIQYNWSGTGLKVSGSNASTQIDTNGLQPGSYTVNANLTDGSKNGSASCNARFNVAAPRPPVISCTPNPSTVQPGGTSTITSSASSPDNRKLTYSYAATSGRISGSEATTTLDAGSTQPGSITITCNVADDRNPALTASATTTVMIEAPPAPAPPPPPAQAEASKLNTVEFKRNSPRVDNAAKAILDEVALRLQRDADAKVVLVGLADTSEAGGKKLAAQRAFNTKAYLVTEKGIDASRVETRTGTEAGTETAIWLVPAGATFKVPDTQVVVQPAPRTKRK
jgi:outer membrane protein OmpA-like peptidoglycan-associated protein